jgi:uncharacterized protein
LRALLDVNVLIALFDVEHVSHARATAWLREWIPNQWCTCPISQNGLIRILSQPSYPRATTTHDMIGRLRDAARTPHHDFIADDISLTSDARFTASAVLGPKTLTDVYLLALAVAHDATFVTFDRRVALGSVIGAKTDHLLVI